MRYLLNDGIVFELTLNLPHYFFSVEILKYLVFRLRVGDLVEAQILLFLNLFHKFHMEQCFSVLLIPLQFRLKIPIDIKLNLALHPAPLSFILSQNDRIKLKNALYEAS